jgi:dihydrofolate reductase
VDDAVGKQVDKLFTPPFDRLLGRRTYDIFAAYWPYAIGEGKSIGRAVRPRRENMW